MGCTKKTSNHPPENRNRDVRLPPPLRNCRFRKSFPVRPACRCLSLRSCSLSLSSALWTAMVTFPASDRFPRRPVGTHYALTPPNLAFHLFGVDGMVESSKPTCHALWKTRQNV